MAEIFAPKRLSGAYPQPDMPHQAIPSSISHQGVEYRIIPATTLQALQAQLEKLKSLQWSFPDRAWLCLGVGAACFACGYALSQSSKPPVIEVEKQVPVEKPIIVERQVPYDRNCFFNCK